MEDRTVVYSAIDASLGANAKLFQRELRAVCNYAANGLVPPEEEGYMDGARAYNQVITRLFPEERTETDIEFYNAAVLRQRGSRLPDGCAGKAFYDKAYQFIVVITERLSEVSMADRAWDRLALPWLGLGNGTWRREPRSLSLLARSDAQVYPLRTRIAPCLLAHGAGGVARQ